MPSSSIGAKMWQAAIQGFLRTQFLIVILQDKVRRAKSTVLQNCFKKSNLVWTSNK